MLSVFLFPKSQISNVQISKFLFFMISSISNFKIPLFQISNVRLCINRIRAIRKAVGLKNLKNNRLENKINKNYLDKHQNPILCVFLPPVVDLGPLKNNRLENKINKISYLDRHQNPVLCASFYRLWSIWGP